MTSTGTAYLCTDCTELVPTPNTGCKACSVAEAALKGDALQDRIKVRDAYRERRNELRRPSEK